MIIDAHVHLFTPKVIENVSAKPEMVAQLHLQAGEASQRIGTAVLETALDRAGVHAALMLPTASADGVSAVNRTAMATAAGCGYLHTAGTLHPECKDLQAEMTTLHAAGIRAIKLCSFSQGFMLDAPHTMTMFAQIESFNRNHSDHFFVVLDTFFKAAAYFGTDPRYTTDPVQINQLVRKFSGITFVGAHMGGLTAPFEKIIRCLPPADNLYLDTSNAAHTLKETEFIQLLRVHGPDRIMFGTDWPWFDPGEEILLIDGLLDRAGYAANDKAKVFGGNIAELLAIADKASSGDNAA
ncbi:MAG: amidohydrolase family protein [Thermodesulfobacteriota bacterium]|nr:amidohydrolase family protein [Thermodesulfobacteriota bacterium]